MTAVTHLTTQSNQAVSAANGSSTFQTLSFANSNGVSFSTGTQGIYASVSPSGGGGVAISAGTNSTSTGTVAFSNANGVTFGMNTDGVVTASITPSGGAQTGISGLSAGTTQMTSGTAVFSNSNGISFGVNGNTVTASHNGLTTAMASNRGSDFMGTNTALTANGVSMTANSSGLSLNFPAFLTTAMQSNRGSDFVQATAAFNGTNASGTIASGAISVSVNAQSVQPVAYSAANGSANFSTLKFVDTNGVSFATSTDGIRATVKTDYLTTARASNDAVGLNTALTAGPLAWTVNSSGISLNAGSAAGTTSGFAGNSISGSITHNTAGINISLNHPAWLTTAMQSNAATISNINVSAGTTSTNASAFTFSNANNFTFGLGTGANAGVITASYTVPTVTNSSFSVQDSATTINPVARIAFSTGNNITLSLSTGASSATVGVAHNLAGTSTGFAGNSISGSMTHNSSGLNISLNHPAWLTTAMQSNAATISNINISAGTTSTNASAFTFNNANGITFGLGTGASVGSITASHNGLTTARASTDAIGLNTAQSNVTWTVNSSGLSLDARGYVGTATGFTGTNVSATMTHNSAGFSLQLSAAAGAGGGAAISAGTNSQSTGTVNFSNSNNMFFGLNTNGVLTASASTVPAGSLVYVNSNGITWGTSTAGATTSVTASINVIETYGSTFVPGEHDYAPGRQFSSSSFGQNTVYLYPVELHYAITGSILRVPMFITNSSSAVSSGQKGQTIRLGIYTTNATNATVLTLWQSTSYTMAASFSSNVSWAQSMITGVGNTTSYNSLTASSAGINLSSSLHGQRDILLPITASFSSGTYWFAFHHSTSGAGTVGNILNMSQAINTWPTFYPMGVVTNATGSGLLQDFGVGSYSTTTGAFPNGISATQINQLGQAPIFYIGNETV